MLSVLRSIIPEKANRVYNLETFLLGLVGAVMIYVRGSLHNFSVVEETIVLVVFLGGLMGITRIPFPSSFRGKPISPAFYPVISGLISGFMDSFLVLLLVGAAELKGEENDQFRFKRLNMIGALIGGLITYFGEVYMLPLALKYGMRDWHSMLPVIPPVVVFLVYLGWRCSKLGIVVAGVKVFGQKEGKKTVADSGDYFEFAVAIGLLLYSQNVLLCLGVLFLHSFLTGQGKDLIEVMKTETEVAVMLLLVAAAFLAEPLTPFMSMFEGWKAFLPSVVNGVFTGAVYPVTGNVWNEVHILSTAVLITPISSLVGVMLFKTGSEWKRYIWQSFPDAIVWFTVSGIWFRLIWPLYEGSFYSVFTRPALSLSGSH